MGAQISRITSISKTEEVGDMSRIVVLLAASLVVVLASGCAQQPQVDVQAEQAAIRKTADVDHLNAAKAGDVDAVLAVYEDSASVLPPDAPIATGKEALRGVWTEITASPSVDWKTTKVEVSSAGDLAYSRGTYELGVTDTEGNPASVVGKWVAVWKKQADGSWKQTVGIWNQDQAEPTPAAKEAAEE
jgi:ketosteroid isomerase-like protein